MILLHYFGVQQASQHPSKPTGNGCQSTSYEHINLEILSYIHSINIMQNRHTSASVVGSSPLNGLHSDDDGVLRMKYWLILIEKYHDCHETTELYMELKQNYLDDQAITFVNEQFKRKLLHCA